MLWLAEPRDLCTIRDQVCALFAVPYNSVATVADDAQHRQGTRRPWIQWLIRFIAPLPSAY